VSAVGFLSLEHYRSPKSPDPKSYLPEAKSIVVLGHRMLYGAMRYLLTADEIPAAEALRLGLVQEVVEMGRQFDRALQIAETISRQAPLGVKASLASARRTRTEGERAAIARLLPDLVPIMKSEDAAEGIRSYVERREGRFKGR
jgi:enoyl-CoA hydratase/carnithine racemase